LRRYGDGVIVAIENGGNLHAAEIIESDINGIPGNDCSGICGRPGRGAVVVSGIYPCHIVGAVYWENRTVIFFFVTEYEGSAK
jgi:hypothetical protein